MNHSPRTLLTVVGFITYIGMHQSSDTDNSGYYNATQHDRCLKI